MKSILRISVFLSLIALLLVASSRPTLHAAEASTIEPSKQFLHYIRNRAADLRKDDKPPASLADWAVDKKGLKRSLGVFWGAFPETPCPLDPKKLGEIKRDGYRVEKIVFQTMPGVWMTSNAYVPDGKGPFPAVLCVHGHWRGAKQDPVVQSRCIGLAKLGFFVLVVDAFGAGERGISKKLGEYHGEMVAATLIPTGRVLAGIQVYENTRAIDYIQSRPEVNPESIGVTGASGGGNQTMYIGAWDERLKAVVPTCSVGNFQAYLGTACCLCEVVPGVLTFTEEWGLLAMVAPRALMVISATKDAPQFSVAEAKKSLAGARPVFALKNASTKIRHAIFESPHAYNQPMREAMYGWMTLHLKGEGDGAPIREPEMKPEDPETIRCFPGDSRPDDWLTLPQFAALEATKILSGIPTPGNDSAWATWKAQKKFDLRIWTMGPLSYPGPPKPAIETTPGKNSQILRVASEPGIDIRARLDPGHAGKTVILVDVKGYEKAAPHKLATELRKANWTVYTLDLRATGQTAHLRDKVGRAADHNTAEWSLLTGRPLLEQWVTDISRFLDSTGIQEATLIGNGPAGVVALCAAAHDKRITQAATVDSLASYVSDVPYENQRLGIMVPGILREFGDIQHIAAVAAPKRLLVARGVNGAGKVLSQSELEAQYSFTRQAAALAKSDFKTLARATSADIVRWLEETKNQ